MDADYRQPQPANRTSQGIVDNKPQSANPSSATNTTDIIVDRDAGVDNPINEVNEARLPGPDSSADSQKVHYGSGHPGSGMTSQEQHGKPQGRKREGQGTAQWGNPSERNIELDRAQRPTGSNEGPTPTSGF